MGELVDTHAHLTDSRFRRDLPQVLQRSAAAGVTAIICVGYDISSSAAGVALAGKHKEVYAAVGVHPHDAAKTAPEYLPELRRLADAEKVVAIGETGLDFYRNISPPTVQEEVFREHLQLAAELKMPVIIHDRQAHNRVLEILDEYLAELAGVVMHCFSGDTDFACRCLERGIYISLAGPVTFKNSGGLTDVARLVHPDKLLLETDSPYLAPEPHRGRRNEPALVACIADKVAAIRNEDPDTLREATTRNANRLFGVEFKNK